VVTLPMRTAPSRPPGRARKSLSTLKRRIGTTLFVLVCVGGLLGAWAWWNGTVGNVPIREHCTAVASGTVHEVDPEQAGNAAIIAAVAVGREMPARAATIGIATAVQESKLRNIEYGDRDSLGLFQQRPSQGWGSKKQILDPVYAANRFYDELAKVDGYESMAITEVAQKVQRSAYPSAYADHEPEGRVMASTLSGYSPAGFSCVLHGPPSDLAEEQPAANGLTPRAADVAAAAGREAGRRDVVAATTDGKTLRFTVPSAEANRYGWSLAQWAVARASQLHVIAVQVGDRKWHRDDSTAGWTASQEALPPGAVVVRVA
jgi:hypothetical protein